MVPNLFRRLLGEGALGTALVPLFSHTLEQEGKHKARQHLTIIFACLGIVLILLCLVVTGGTFLLRPYVTTDYGQNALKLIPLLMPYAFFICFVGIVGAILNSIRVFFLPALGALLLNISIIGCLLFVAPGFHGNMGKILNSLSWAVLLAGFAQFLLMLLLLWHKGFFPALRGFKMENFPVLRELWTLTLPGLIGASALQISFLVDRLLGAYLGPQAVPALTYTDRIIFLPISVFGLALGSVLLANMSRSAAKKNYTEMFDALRLGLRHIIYICVPIAIFTVIFREEILKLIYLRGKFTESDLHETAWAALFYGCGIPFFAAIKIVVSAFYARKDMKTPLKVSLLCITVNIILNIILMFPLRQGGIALATVITAALNNLFLLYLLRREFQLNLRLRVVLNTLLKAGTAAAIIAVCLYFTYPRLSAILPEPLPEVQGLLPLTITGIAFCVVYALVTLVINCKEPRELLGMFRRD
jgi:putative peptidoglycan lipid II flippase